jgi:hypothetical protein
LRKHYRNNYCTSGWQAVIKNVHEVESMIVRITTLAGCLIALLLCLTLCDRAFSNTASDIFFEAVWDHDFTKTKAMLEKHPELVYARDQNNNTPLHIAAKSGFIDIAQLLVAKDANIN